MGRFLVFPDPQDEGDPLATHRRVAELTAEPRGIEACLAGYKLSGLGTGRDSQANQSRIRGRLQAARLRKTSQPLGRHTR